MTPKYWHKATAHLSQNCPVMAGIIANYTRGDTLKLKGKAYTTLMRAIAGQQISVKAADSIWAKLEKKVVPLTPEKLLRTRESTLRACGFSQSKIAYMRNLSQFFRDHDIHSEGYWQALSDEEVIAQLTSIKGIGVWTAEMFLIFYLGRPDVLPLKDLGLLKGIDMHFHKGKRKKTAAYVKIAKKWAPYRSVATWYLWRSLDPVAVEY